MLISLVIVRAEIVFYTKQRFRKLMGNTRKCQHIADTVAHTDEEHDDCRGFHSLFHRCNQVLPVEFTINSTFRFLQYGRLRTAE